MAEATATEAAWRALVERALAGRDFSELTSRFAGDRLSPLYPAAHGHPIRAGGASWTVYETLAGPDRAEAAHALDGGATGIALAPNGAQAEGEVGAVAEILELCAARSAALRLEGAAAAYGPALASRRGGKPPRLELGLDLLGQAALEGNRPGDWQRTARDWIAAIAPAPGRTLFRADGRIVHEAGGDDVTELAFALSAWLAYFRLLLDVGLPPQDAAATVEVALAVDMVEFAGISKLRAMRLLQARLLEASGLPAVPLRLHGQSSRRMLTRLDPHSNAIRATIAAAAAAIGGADSIAIRPHDGIDAPPSPAARRLARNIALIATAEAHLSRVVDPAAGSGAMEAMTLSLARAAWEEFQGIEAAGGLAAALGDGLVQRRVAEARANRDAGLASGADAIIGTTRHRAPDAVMPRSPVSPSQPTEMEALRPIRAAAAFEAAP